MSDLINDYAPRSGYEAALADSLNAEIVRLKEIIKDYAQICKYQQREIKETDKKLGTARKELRRVEVRKERWRRIALDLAKCNPLIRTAAIDMK